MWAPCVGGSVCMCVRVSGVCVCVCVCVCQCFFFNVCTRFVIFFARGKSAGVPFIFRNIPTPFLMKKIDTQAKHTCVSKKE